MGAAKVVLVVDDDPVVTRFVTGVLRQLGYKVKVAEDGLQALDRVNKEKFDLILLDMIMPQMNGYQFCKALEDKKLAHPPMVVLMSSVDERIADRMMKSTCTVDFIPKPVTAQKLHAALEKYIPSSPEGDGGSLDGQE